MNTSKSILTSLFFLLLCPVFGQSKKDTIINKVKYNWVKYDLNKNPYEIGQDYTNGIKNGKWIFRDHRGRITSILNYINDTISGEAIYFDYMNDPTATQTSGLMLKNNKVGIWVSKKKQNRHNFLSRWVTYGTLMYDTNGKLISRTVLNKRGKPVYDAFYDKKGEECFWRFYNKRGKLKRETNIYPYITVQI